MTVQKIIVQKITLDEVERLDALCYIKDKIYYLCEISNIAYVYDPEDSISISIDDAKLYYGHGLYEEHMHCILQVDITSAYPSKWHREFFIEISTIMNDLLGFY